jgi:hypothetical protein
MTQFEGKPTNLKVNACADNGKEEVGKTGNSRTMVAMDLGLDLEEECVLCGEAV